MSVSGEGERLFAAYLRQRPDLVSMREPLSGSRRPDFIVSAPQGDAICEVFSPELILPNRVGAFDSFSPVSRAFGGRKRTQGAQAKLEGTPFVVVISSQNSDVPLDSLDLLVGAFGGRRPLQPKKNTRFSAIAVVAAMNPTQSRFDSALRERLPLRPDLETAFEAAVGLEDEMRATGSFDPDARVARLDVVHNPWAATPLPLDFFGGPHDRQFRVVEGGRNRHLDLCWSGWRISEVPTD